MVSWGAVLEKLQQVRHCGSQFFPISRPRRCMASSVLCLAAPHSSDSGEGAVGRGCVVCKSTSTCVLRSVLKLLPFSYITPSTSRVIVSIRIFNIYFTELLFQPPFSYWDNDRACCSLEKQHGISCSLEKDRETPFQFGPWFLLFVSINRSQAPGRHRLIHLFTLFRPSL